MAMSIFKEIPLKGYKKTIPWIIVMMICMIVIPLIAHLSGNDDTGVIASLISFFAMPVYTILLGVFAGEDIKHQWFLPAVPIVFRYIGGWICNEGLGVNDFFTWSLIAGFVAAVISTVANVVVRTKGKKSLDESPEERSKDKIKHDILFVWKQNQ